MFDDNKIKEMRQALDDVYLEVQSNNVDDTVIKAFDNISKTLVLSTNMILQLSLKINELEESIEELKNQ